MYIPRVSSKPGVKNPGRQNPAGKTRGKTRDGKTRDAKPGTVTYLSQNPAKPGAKPGTVTYLLTPPAQTRTIKLMPRVARIVMPQMPHHVVQRGNNRQDVFFTDDDRRMYLAMLREESQRF